MSSKSETCRAKAEECEAMARTVGDDGVRAQFLELARKWRMMAEQKAELEARRSRSG